MCERRYICMHVIVLQQTCTTWTRGVVENIFLNNRLDIHMTDKSIRYLMAILIHSIYFYNEVTLFATNCVILSSKPSVCPKTLCTSGRKFWRPDAIKYGISWRLSLACRLCLRQHLRASCVILPLPLYTSTPLRLSYCRSSPMSPHCLLRSSHGHTRSPFITTVNLQLLMIYFNPLTITSCHLSLLSISHSYWLSQYIGHVLPIPFPTGGEPWVSIYVTSLNFLPQPASLGTDISYARRHRYHSRRVLGIQIHTCIQFSAVLGDLIPSMPGKIATTAGGSWGSTCLHLLNSLPQPASPRRGVSYARGHHYYSRHVLGINIHTCIQFSAPASESQETTCGSDFARHS